jgi:hypothetical protein
MAFKRIRTPAEPLQGEGLTSAMAGIGMNFAARATPSANIEDTVLAASVAGMVQDDFRVLSVLVTWLETHSAWINVDRLTHLVLTHPSLRVRLFWSGVAVWLGKDRRLARMAKSYGGPRVDLLATGTDFHIRRSGEDLRFKDGPMRIPAGILRNRAADVLTPVELARVHTTYRRRILLGPSYRADMWAELDANPTLSAAELARRTYGSFATAWHVRQDWDVLAGAVVLSVTGTPEGGKGPGGRTH